MSLHSYSSIYDLGHAAVKDLFNEEVTIEEKCVGSQISFGVFDGELQMRSKGAQINVVAPEGMFAKAVEYISSIKERLQPGWSYRGEYLGKAKHGVLNYDRTPNNYIIIFDIDPGEQNYLAPDAKRAEATRIGLECVPELYRGRVGDPSTLRILLDTPSILGGHKVEGIVVKPLVPNLFGRDKKLLMARFVSEAFQETHAKTWTKEHATPGQGDIIALIGARLTTQARWSKARIHLAEAGKLKSSSRDIGLLIREVPEDIRKECEEQIKYDLFKWAWPKLRRIVTRGLPEWYKEQLLKSQFENKEEEAA